MSLHRELAPLSEAAWKAIEEEAADVLKLHLGARRLMDFEGPLGWSHSALDLGDVDELEGTVKGARVRRRRVRPLIELRVPFRLPRREIERIDRGARDPELGAVHEAAQLFAAAEDTALFEGYADAGIPGLVTDAGQEGVLLPAEDAGLVDAVADALAQLRRAAVGGPYGLALGPEAYRCLDRGAVDGYPVRRHVQRLIDGPLVWSAALNGGAVVSLRGGDARFVCGRDVAVGYRSHDEESVSLYLEESFTAELLEPAAAVPLLPARDPTAS